MKTMEDIKTLKIGEVITVPWENLPKPAPEKGAAFGGQGMFFIAAPKLEGLEVKRVTQAEVMTWKDENE